MGSGRELTEETTPSIKERLDPADLADGGLLAASHLHRYELVAPLVAGARVLDLCCGSGYGTRILAREAAAAHGVDIAGDAVATARAQLVGEEGERVTFERADALEYLRALAQDSVQWIVCFEGLEHVPDADAVVSELVRLAAAGTRVVISVPNSRGFEEVNEFHVEDFGYEEMRAVATRFGEPVVLSQYLAEASLILPADASSGGELNGRLVDRADDDPESVWANHWLILAGVGAAEVERAQALAALSASANHNAYMRLLESANRELRHANARMARERLGHHDAAAAAAVPRITDLERALEEQRKLAQYHEHTARQAKAALEAPRYRAIDALRRLLFRVPGLSTLLHLRRRLIQRRP